MIEQLEVFDRELFLWLNGLHADWLDQPMYWMTDARVWTPLYLFFLWAIAPAFFYCPFLVAASPLLSFLPISLCGSAPLFILPVFVAAAPQLFILPNSHSGSAPDF